MTPPLCRQNRPGHRRRETHRPKPSPSPRRAGADVAITYRNSASEADDTGRPSQPSAFAPLPSPAMCATKQASTPAVGRTPRISAGSISWSTTPEPSRQPLEDITVPQWDAMFAANTRGPFLVAKAAHPALQRSPRPHHQHRLPRRHPSLGHPRPLLHLQGRPAHALADHGQGLGARDQRQLRRAGHDRVRRARRRLRCTSPREHPCSATAPPPTWPPRSSSSPPRPHFITGQILAVDGGLGL